MIYFLKVQTSIKKISLVTGSLILLSTLVLTIFYPNLEKTNQNNSAYHQLNFSSRDFNRDFGRTFNSREFTTGNFGEVSYYPQKPNNKINFYNLFKFYLMVFGLVIIFFSSSNKKVIAMNKYWSETSIIIGAMLILYNLLHYEYRRVGGTSGTYLYLAEGYIIGLVLGVGLLLLGIFAIIKKNERNNN